MKRLTIFAGIKKGIALTIVATMILMLIPVAAFAEGVEQFSQDNTGQTPVVQEGVTAESIELKAWSADKLNTLVTTEIDTNNVSALATPSDSEILPLALNDSLIVDGINYLITKMPSGTTNGTVIVADNRNYDAGTTLVIPETITVAGTFANDGTYVVTDISNNAFELNTNFTSLTLPASAIQIGINAFRDCSALATVNFPATGSITIGRSAFEGSGLTSVTITEGVAAIGNYSFKNCSSLVSLNLPAAGSYGIGDFAFENTGLTSLTIPANVNGLGREAFAGCASLTAVFFLGDKPAIGDWVFRNLPAEAKAYYISGSAGFTPDDFYTPLALLTALELQDKTLSIDVGQTKTLLVKTALPELTGDLLWLSSDTNVATVSSSGVVEGVAAGAATITARAMQVDSNTGQASLLDASCQVTTVEKNTSCIGIIISIIKTIIRWIFW